VNTLAIGLAHVPELLPAAQEALKKFPVPM